ncbi:nucleotide exchange factor GrpE [Nodosilinea sp. P-1105]|nr:nucleotide exchange factor GrpE [Nodosilinea sp. P-1105]NMF84828.1 nucleotide exchange factor GrpE [Nodosilinea sp. P-1105]
MVDEMHQTEDYQAPSPQDEQELRVEDADVDIDFDGVINDVAAVATEEAGAEGAASETSAEPGGESSAAIADLERQIAGLKAQLEERSSQSMRIAADFENYRKRTSKEKEELEGQIKGNTITELLPVVDNFERARSQIKPQTEAEMTIHKSYQSVYKQLVETLKRLGVSAMRAEGQEFDPNLHEAVMREPTAAHPDGTVIEEFVRGYQLGERVLRHAMVKVAAPPEDGAEAAGADQTTTAE